jgi:hypothetical protein
VLRAGAKDQTNLNTQLRRGRRVLLPELTAALSCASINVDHVSRMSPVSSRFRTP